MSFRQASLEQVVPVLPYGADNFTQTLSVGDTVATWKFYKKSTQVAQWVLTYTDNARTVLLSGAFTDLSA